VVRVSKKARSFSIDEDLADLLSERDDLNASAVVNKFLREYVAEGRGEEAALEIRLNQLDDEIAELEKQLTKKQRERDRIQSQLESRQSELRDQLLKAEEIVEQSPMFWDGPIGTGRPDISEDNDMIQKYAAEAGVPVDRFVNELEARL
jgi:DNA repair exonuclease SbcCD ATPase subunit